MSEDKYLEIQKEHVEKANLPRLTKELSQEVKKIDKAKKKIKKDKTPEDIDKTKRYMEIVQKKIMLVLEALTNDKIDSATGAQLAKILRTLSSELASGRGGNVEDLGKKTDEPDVDVEKMDIETLKEFLSKKSQDRD